MLTVENCAYHTKSGKCTKQAPSTISIPFRPCGGEVNVFCFQLNNTEKEQQYRRVIPQNIPEPIKNEPQDTPEPLEVKIGQILPRKTRVRRK